MVDPSEDTGVLDAIRALEPETEHPSAQLTAQVTRAANGIESLTAAVHAQTEVLLLLTAEFRDRPVPEHGAQARLIRNKPAPSLKRWKT
jgi:hypothetical protein